uniref:Putative sarcoplasmic reticulum glycoprotein n=1 Tax=Trypanosoma congolense (strain IL3000) TaxID=1068625 RepID=G0UYN0_TRYCI|nr:putative sarcoplasmic reticulum glycoprotein [Trypanosoma congolense IL3000]
MSGGGPLLANRPQDFNHGGMEEFVSRLRDVYLNAVMPLEKTYAFEVLNSRWFEETLCTHRPIVTFLGPWSAGKSTFINYLLQNNYLFTGPQPTTAEFTVVTYGEDVCTIDGHVLANSKDYPFRAVSNFGEEFLSSFVGMQVPHELLKRITLIDTPGVLENSTDSRERRYDYSRVCRWFVERSDLVFLIFDPAKLDVGVELRSLITHTIKGMEGKVRIILNKADSVPKKELMRVYGSLFWSLSTLITCTEPPRVYVGSFWDQPYKPGTFSLLFTKEKEDLLYELMELVPRQARDRKVAALVTHAKRVLSHAYIVGGIRADLPVLFGKEKAIRKALEKLPLTYETIAARSRLSVKDFPPVEQYRDFVNKVPLEKFPDLKKVEKMGLISNIQNCIAVTLPAMFCAVKRVPVPDPRNKAEQARLREMYNDGIRNQYEGREGKQGSSDTVAPAVRDSALHVPREAWGASPYQSNTLSLGAPANGTIQIHEQQQMLMQMMAIMQQQQQQQ